MPRHELKNRISKKQRLILVILFWLLFWELAARITDNSIILVGPLDTGAELMRLCREQSFWSSVLTTLLRILTGFFLSAITAVLLGIVSYFLPLLRDLMAPIIKLMKAIPVASFVILALIWLRGSRYLGTAVSFIVTFPMLWESTVAGLSDHDRRFWELGQVFELGYIRQLRYIYAPALLPQLMTGLSSAVGMAWKSGVAAELIGQPAGTIGFYLYQSKVFLDTAGVFAWTLVIIVLSYACERGMRLLIRKISQRL